MSCFPGRARQPRRRCQARAAKRATPAAWGAPRRAAQDGAAAPAAGEAADGGGGALGPQQRAAAEVRCRARTAVLMQRCVAAVHQRCGDAMPPGAQLRLLSVLQARPAGPPRAQRPRARLQRRSMCHSFRGSSH